MQISILNQRTEDDDFQIKMYNMSLSQEGLEWGMEKAPQWETS